MTQIVFQREVLIDAPLAHVWQLVATESGLRQWWGNTIYLEAKEGGRCEEWRPSRNKTAHWQGVVTQYTPPHQLMLTLRAQEPQQDGQELSTISIALETKGEQTRVHVTQRAFGAAPTISTNDPRETITQPTTQPTTQQGMPFAQLNRPAPGNIPLPTTTMTATRGIEATNNALRLTWQSRFTSLAAAITQVDAQ